MEKLYYTISEVAQLLQETTVTVRYWSNQFARFLDPKRNAKGNRLYMEKDISVLRRIQYLTRDCGLSLDATMKKLSEKDDDSDKMLKIKESLLSLRTKLLKIRDTL